MDGQARHGSEADHNDEKHHLAKVRVAGSNPVFRSIVAGQIHFFNVDPPCGQSPRVRLQPAARCAIALSLIRLDDRYPGPRAENSVWRGGENLVQTNSVSVISKQHFLCVCGAA